MWKNTHPMVKTYLKRKEENNWTTQNLRSLNLAVNSSVIRQNKRRQLNSYLELRKYCK